VDEVRSQLKEDASEALAIAGIYIVLALILLLGILMISISLAYLLGTWLGTHWGFLIIGTLYIIGGAFYWLYFKNPDNQLKVKERVGEMVQGSVNTDEFSENEAEDYSDPI
jgi:hypothetical protein